MRRWFRSVKMCQNFSESVSRILTAVEQHKVRSLSLAAEVTPTPSPSRRPFTVMVEGNIGSGKSTYLRHFTKFSDNVEVVMEPVEKWRNLNTHNLLQMMYEDPCRWSLTFQTYVQLTMLQNHTLQTDKPVKLMERSLHSAKYCFAENLRRTGKMPESEYLVLTRWFDFMLQSEDLDLTVDLIVYLQTDPEVALRRLRERSRGEEHLIDEGYIRDLHALHEDWLMEKKFPVPAPVLVVDANKDIGDMTEIFRVISDKWSVREGDEVRKEDKENTPEVVKAKRTGEEFSDSDRKKKSILSNSN